MKKSVSACQPPLQANLSKKLLFTFIASLAMLSSFATSYSSTGTGGSWGTAGTWSPSGVPTSSDDVTITNGTTVTVDAGSAICNNVTINSGGTLKLNGNALTVAGNWSNNGTFSVNNNNATTEVVTFTGASATIGGSSLSSFPGIKINSTGTVTVTRANIEVGTSNQPGAVTLQSGIFDIGAGHSLDFPSQYAYTIDASGGGDFKSYGPSGWTLNVGTGYNNFITTKGKVDLDNVTPIIPGHTNHGYQIDNQTAGSATTGLHINGKLIVSGDQAQNWGIITNAPVWGPSSTLYIDGRDIAYSIGRATGASGNPVDKSWLQMTSGTIGVTPGYPNNVTIFNVGTSATGVVLPGSSTTVNVGWAPTGDIAINGTLTIGDPSVTTGGTNGVTSNTGFVSLGAVNSFSSGGIVVDNSSKLIGPPSAAAFNDNGNFTLQGTTTGIFYDFGATINFGGSPGTLYSPQYISTTDASGLLTFNNVIVSHGAYVQLQDDVAIGGTLTFDQVNGTTKGGYIGTSTTNSLTIVNQATTAVSGGGNNAYVDGPLSWSLPASTTSSYVFPVGDHAAGAYLPLTLTSPSSAGGTVATVTAFDHNSGGSPGPTVNSISTTEYWSVSTTAGAPFNGSTKVTAQRPSAVTPFNALAISTSANGLYKAIGGTANTGTPGTISDGGLGNGSPVFVVMANAPLSAVKLGGTSAGLDATCTPVDGSLIVGGSGGTPGYTYSMTGATGPWLSSGTFTNLAKGTYQVWVKDNATPTPQVATAFLDVPGSLLINGDNSDIDICSGQSATLSASNLLNPSAVYTWTSSPSTTMSPSSTSPTITVSPTVNPTTYTVSSTVYNPNSNKVVNGSFESGDVSIGSGYNDYSAQPQYTDTPGNNGYYSITTAGTSLCKWFSIAGPANGAALAPQDGTKYLVGDGATSNPQKVWSQTISGLTSGVTYQFSYYYASASISSPHSVLTTSFTNPTTTTSSVTASSSTGWTQAVYTFTPNATSTTIQINNTTTGIGGNDFYIDNIQFLSSCSMTQSIKVTINCVAPVTYLDFTAVKQGEGALLNWETANETNSAYFVIEKSSDGTSFEPIGKITAAGNSSTIHSYSFTDPSIATGITYYRLAQYDIDGAVHYSIIKEVSKNGVTGVQVIPNPNNGTFVVAFDNTGDVKSRISVLNALGQIVYEGAESSTNYHKIDISALATGIYYLHVSTDAENIVKKILKE